MILLYIDPGTGSILFSVLLGIVTASFFGLQKICLRLKGIILGGRAEKVSKNKIPVVIFSDSKRYWNTFEPICAELDKRGIYTEYWTESEDDPAFEQTYDNIRCLYVGSINKAVTKLNVMNAFICLSTTPGLDVYQWKRSKNTNYYIHIFHSVSSGVTYRMFGLDFYDVLMLPGDYVEENVRKIEEIRHLPPKEMIKIGIPYLDGMMCAASNIGIDDKKGITVLVAPTWGVNSLFNQMGDELIDGLIATGYNIIIRPHPQSYTAEEELIKRLQSKYPENERFHWNDDNDNLAVLSRSDVLISDYSGVLYDFALVFDRPVIYSLPIFNKDPYDAWFLDGNPRFITILEEMAVQLTRDNMTDIKCLIDKALTDTENAAARAQARSQFWYNHGTAAKECVDYIENRYEEYLNSEQEFVEDKVN